MNVNNEDFADQFLNDFKKGDLIYGLSSARIDFILAVKKQILGAGYVTVDEMNYRAIHSRSGEYNKNKVKQDPQAQAHFTFLESHHKYHPENASKVISQNDMVNYNAYMRAIKALRLKWACKGGILHILESSTQRIHFILKDFDYKIAFNKVGEKGDISETKYTNSEFRLIYRIWRASPEVVDQKVIFWNEHGQKILASDYFKSIQHEIKYTPKNEDSINKLRTWASRLKINSKERMI